MSLLTMLSNIGKAAKGVGGKVILLGKAHAPEIGIATGITLFGVTIYETVKATNETRDILEEKEQKEAIIIKEKEENPEYTTEMMVVDQKQIKAKTRWGIVKSWGKVTISAVGAVISVLWGFGKMKGRWLATTAVLDSWKEFTNRYRKNVVDEFGEEVDWRMAHSIKAEELEAERKKQDQIREKKKKGSSRIPRTQYNKHINNQIFDCHSSEKWKPYWTANQMLDFIYTVESQIADLVELRGFALLNDAYDKLGMPLTSQGAIMGWIKRPSNTHREPGNRVSLGFANNETPVEEIRRILSITRNEDLYTWITPNCDGVIYKMIDKPFSSRDDDDDE